MSVHNFLSKDLGDTLDALNEFILDRRSSGEMEREFQKWFGVNQSRASAHSSKQAAGDPEPTSIILIISSVGTVMTLTALVFSWFNDDQNDNLDPVAQSVNRTISMNRNNTFNKGRYFIVM